MKSSMRKVVVRRAWRLARLAATLFLAAACEAKGVVDSLGRQVEVPNSPQRIVSLAPSLTETLFALGLGNRVVGVTDYCQHPSEAMTKAKVGGIINPSLERIVSLRPDLVFVTSEGNKYEIIEQLSRFHIPAFSITPKTLEGVLESIQLMGRAAGAEAAARQLVAQLAGRIQQVKLRVQGRPVPRVLVLYDTKPVVTGGRHTYPTGLIAAAGGRSIAAGLQQEWPRLNIEFVIQADPEILVLAAMPDSHKTAEELKTLPGWKMTTAVRSQRIFAVDDAINQPGPRLIDGLEQLARLIHPEAFGK